MSDSINKDTDPNEWVEQYANYLYKKAYWLVGSAETAEDLVQETFLSAFQNLDGFRGQAAVKTWLLTILKNKAIDYMRKAVNKELPTDFSENTNQDENSDFNSWGLWKNHFSRWTKWSVWDTEAYDQLEAKGLNLTLFNCIEKLPKAQKLLIKFKVFEGMSVDQICNKLDIQTSNAAVLLFRSRMALRKCLDKNWFNKA